MSITARDQEIAAAQAYENLHVPALFKQWAPLMLDAADVRPGDRILDVACGTGVLAREAKARFGDSCSVTGLDAGASMLPVMGIVLADDLIETILNEAECVLSSYVTESGQVEFDAPAHIVTARAA